MNSAEKSRYHEVYARSLAEPLVIDFRAYVLPADPDPDLMHFFAVWRPDEVFSGDRFADRRVLGVRGRGVFVCISPWNFPLAIFTGQVAAALAKGAPVIVLYMALKHIERIAERLIAGGRDPHAAVAVVARATTPDQRVLETTLSRAAADVAEAGIEPPAMVVIGEVVKLRAAMDWLGAMGGRKLVADPLGQRQRDQVG